MEGGRTFRPRERREMKHLAIARSRGKGAKRRYDFTLSLSTYESIKITWPSRASELGWAFA